MKEKTIGEQVLDHEIERAWGELTTLVHRVGALAVRGELRTRLQLESVAADLRNLTNRFNRLAESVE